MAPLASAAVLLINLIFGAYIFILLLRVLMQKSGANYHNPITQMVIKVTEPVIKPLRRILPGFRGFDLAIIFLALLLECITVYILFGLSYSFFPGVLGTIVMGIGELGNTLMNIYFFAVIINVVMSWVTSLQHNPAAEIIDMICRPWLRLVGRFLPPLGGFDLSPIVVLLAAKLLTILVFNPIIMAGSGLAM